MQNKSRWRSKESFWGYFFIAPPMLGFILFGLIPICFSIFISLSKYDTFNPPKFIGASNFIRLFTQDPLFWKTMGNTLYACMGIPFCILISILIAVGLTRDIRGINFYRTMFFLPTICSVVALTLLWKWIFNSDFGVLNYFLQLVGIQGPAWLSSEKWAMPAMIIQGVWGGLGFNMVMYIAAIKAVPQTFYEAAETDGASALRQFIHITIPCISPTTFYIFVTSLIGALQDFPRFMIMTEGGPNFSTTTIVYYLFNNAFRYTDMGYSSAMAWVLAVVIMVITVINFRMSQRWVHYD